MIKLLCMTFVCLGSLASPAMAKSPSKNEVSTEASVLYIVHAKKAKISKANDYYQLTLNNVDKSISYFSEEPRRLAGKVSLDKFIHDWNQGRNSFANNPPNAGLAILKGDDAKKKKYQEFVVELTSPQYKKRANRLTFDIYPVGENKHLDEETLEEVSLFIDHGTIININVH